jgi:hypothetical protein
MCCNWYRITNKQLTKEFAFPILQHRYMKRHTNQYSETNVMHFYSFFKELSASTCFEHHLLILRRRYTNDTWYTAFVLCQLAAPGAAN